jgi:sugar phosphate isomerase/epimerase
MNARIARRQFLKAGATAAVGAGFAFPARSSAAGRPPDGRGDAGPRLFAGCCAYSFSAYLENYRMTMEDFILKGAELGVRGVDLTAYWLMSTDPDYLIGLRHLGFRKCMAFSGTAIGARMVRADASQRTQVLDEIKKWVDATDRLGASHIRVFAGKLPPGASTEQGIQWTVEVMKAATDYSGRKGISLGIEDHDGITQHADVLLEILHRVDSPYAGVNLDITNFLPTPTEDAYAQIDACIPYATHTHIRDHFADGTPVDLDRVWQLFAKHGYDGYMSAEYEGKEDAVTAVPRLIERIKTLCAKYSTA